MNQAVKIDDVQHKRPTWNLVVPWWIWAVLAFLRKKNKKKDQKKKEAEDRRRRRRDEEKRRRRNRFVFVLCFFLASSFPAPIPPLFRRRLSAVGVMAARLNFPRPASLVAELRLSFLLLISEFSFLRFLLLLLLFFFSPPDEWIQRGSPFQYQRNEHYLFFCPQNVTGLDWFVYCFTGFSSSVWDLFLVSLGFRSLRDEPSFFF